MFARSSPFAFDRKRARCFAGPPLWLCIGVLLAMCGNSACAAALGSFVSSVGLFAALAALFVIKGWQAQLSQTALSMAGGTLVIAAGAVWLWRGRAGGRGLGVASGRGGRDARKALVGIERPAALALVRIPDGIDRAALLVELRLHFVRLQEAWDLGAMPALQALTTADMLDELCLGLPASTSESTSGRTDIVTLHAELFACEDLSGTLLVSVEFSGLMRESSDQSAAPFRELWMLTKSKGCHSGWKLARHQALL